MAYSFGFLLRQYRNKSIDPRTGRRLSQEALGSLIGEELGTPYSAQAISDWEREKSQIHKDHRQVLRAIIKILHACGGISSPEEAESLLAAGNYRGLSHAEVETIFLTQTPTKSCTTDSISLTWQKKNLTPTNVLSGTMGTLCWIATWLAIHPILDFSNTDQSQLLGNAITLTVTGLVIPAIIAWVLALQPGPSPSFASSALNYFGGIVGFSLGFSNVLALAQVSYNLYLYPWPPLLIFGFSLWPVVLSLVSADLTHRQLKTAKKEIHFRDFHFRWIVLVLPPAIGALLYNLHPVFSNRLLGPLLSMTLAMGLGALLWFQTRNSG